MPIKTKTIAQKRAACKETLQQCREQLLLYLNKLGADRVHLTQLHLKDNARVCLKRQVAVSQKAVTPLIIEAAWTDIYRWERLQMLLLYAEMPLIEAVSSLFAPHVHRLSRVVRPYADVVELDSPENRRRSRILDESEALRGLELTDEAIKIPAELYSMAKEVWQTKIAAKKLNQKQTITATPLPNTNTPINARDAMVSNTPKTREGDINAKQARAATSKSTKSFSMKLIRRLAPAVLASLHSRMPVNIRDRSELPIITPEAVVAAFRREERLQQQ